MCISTAHHLEQMYNTGHYIALTLPIMTSGETNCKLLLFANKALVTNT